MFLQTNNARIGAHAVLHDWSIRACGCQVATPGTVWHAAEVKAQGMYPMVRMISGEWSDKCALPTHPKGSQKHRLRITNLPRETA